MYKFLEQTVAGYMTRAAKTVTRERTVRDLSEMFERDDFNSYPVEEDGQVVGIVTKFDLLKCFIFTPSQMIPPYEQLMSRTVGDVMTSEFIYVRTDTQTDPGAAADGRSPHPERAGDRRRTSAGRYHRAQGRSQGTCGLFRRLKLRRLGPWSFQFATFSRVRTARRIAFAK